MGSNGKESTIAKHNLRRGEKMLTSYLAVAVLTTIGAVVDAYGFIWADRAWVQGRLDWPAVAVAVAAYTAGMAFYLFALRYLAKLGNIDVSMQAAGWYVITTIGVMIASGVAFEWSWVDHLLALASIGSLTLLIVRHN